MLEFSYYTQDVRVTNPQSGSKVTLQLTSTGDLQLTSGQEKLTSQLIRTLINDDSPLKDLINQKVSKGKLNSIVTTILKGFKNTQLDTVNGQNPTLTGYMLHRKAAGTSGDFVQVGNSIIEWKLEDLNLTNNMKYSYALSKIYDNGSESSFIDMIEITPTKNLNKDVIIGNGGIFVAGLFYREFINPGRPWLHLHIAGAAFNPGKAHGYTPVGRTGIALRSLITLIEGA